jgi:hypothetical protein
MHKPSFVCCCLILGLVVIAGCSRSDAPNSNPHAATLDIKDLMNWVIDPNARIVFSSVGTDITAQGEKQFAPKTDEQWNVVRNSAATVLEAGNLLTMDGRARDRGEWIARAKGMSDAAAAALKAIDVKDPDSLFIAAGDLYQACSDCHAKYIFGSQPDAQK